MKGDIYCGRLETWIWARAKTPGFDDRERVHISNIDPFTIIESRELSRGPKSKFQVDRSITTFCGEETIEAGARFGRSLQGGEVIALFGDLGSGKTTFLKGLISAITGCTLDEVTSPTFTYLHIHSGEPTVYHFDLYRLKTADEFEELGLREYFGENGICCLEWAERIENRLPKNAIRIIFSHKGQQERSIGFSNGSFR